MELKRYHRDFLTGIPNEEYIKDIFPSFIKENDNTSIVMIDFKKFKAINDNFGHNVGDECLQTFAAILYATFNEDPRDYKRYGELFNKVFKSESPILESEDSKSVVSRLHGDEYCILTTLDYDGIKEKLDIVNSRIKESVVVKEKLGGKPFQFNAGVAPCSETLEESKSNADFVLYWAKSHNETYNVLNDEIISAKNAKDNLVAGVRDGVKDKSITHILRPYYSSDDNKEVGISEISSRGKDGSSIITEENVSVLKANNLLTDLDMYNLDALFKKIGDINDYLLINFDSGTIYANSNLDEIIKEKLVKYNINPGHIIISVSLKNIDDNVFNNISDTLNKVKKLGIKICADKVSSSIKDSYIIKLNPEYLKYDPSYVNSLDSDIEKELFKLILKFYSDHGMKPMFTFAKDKETYNKITELSKGTKVFITGDYLEKEKRI